MAFSTNVFKKVLRESFVWCAILCGVIFTAFKAIQLPENAFGTCHDFDYYALAHGFDQNNLNLFSPQTFVLNDRYNAHKPTSENQITAARLPLNTFAAAVLKQFLPISLHESLRWVNMAFFCGALYCMFCLAFLFIEEFWQSLGITLMLSMVPSFFNLSVSFNDGAQLLFFVFGGAYFYFNAYVNTIRRSYYWGFVFLLVAGMSHIAGFGYLVIAILIDVFFALINKRFFRYKYRTWAVMGALFTIYNIYYFNKLHRYGSIFQYPFGGTFNELIRNVFFPGQALVLGVVILVALIYYIGWKRHFVAARKHLLFFTAIMFIFLLIQKQNNTLGGNGEAYMILCYLPLLFFFMVYLLSILPARKIFQYIMITLLLVPIAIVYPDFKQSFEDYTNRNEEYQQVDFALQEAKEMFQQLDAKQYEKVLLLNSECANYPLYKIGLQGRSFQFREKHQMDAELDKGFEYLVVQNESVLSKVLNVYPEIVYKIKLLKKGDGISIYRNKYHVSDAVNFLGFNHDTRILHETWSNENENDHFINDEKKSEFVRHDFVRVPYVDEDKEFGLGYYNNMFLSYNDSRVTFLIEAQLSALKNLAQDCWFVFELHKADNLLFKTETPWHHFIKVDEFVTLYDMQSYSFQPGKYTVKAYLWNKGRSNIIINDMDVQAFVMNPTIAY